MAQYGLRLGSKVTIELDGDAIRIVPRLPTQDDIENRALRLLLRSLGDAVVVKAQQLDTTETDRATGGWPVGIYARGVDAPVGHLDYAQNGQLLSDPLCSWSKILNYILRLMDS